MITLTEMRTIRKVAETLAKQDISNTIILWEKGDFRLAFHRQRLVVLNHARVFHSIFWAILSKNQEVVTGAVSIPNQEEKTLMRVFFKAFNLKHLKPGMTHQVEKIPPLSEDQE